jgi:hypothetical protein
LSGDVESAVASMRRSVLEAPPEQRPALIDRLRAELDELAKNMAAADARDPIVRAQRMAQFPALVAAQRDRERAARTSAPKKT